MPPAGTETPNRLTLFVAEDGSLSYELVSRKAGTSIGKIDINKPLATGWADWQLKIEKVMPHAESWMDFAPMKSSKAGELAAKFDIVMGVTPEV